MNENLNYTFYFDGPSHILGASIDPMEKNIVKLIDSYNWSYNNNIIKDYSVFYFNTTPTASFKAVKIFAFGIVLTVANWALDKSLDELYDLKVREAIVDYYDETLNNVPSGKDFVFEYRNMVFYKEYNTLVIIRMRSKSPKEFEQMFEFLIDIHKMALRYLKENGQKAPIHDYILENNHVNIEPNLFNTLDDMKNDTRDNIMIIKAKK